MEGLPRSHRNRTDGQAEATANRRAESNSAD
jgi:hypothetical protein